MLRFWITSSRQRIGGGGSGVCAPGGMFALALLAASYFVNVMVIILKRFLDFIPLCMTIGAERRPTTGRSRCR